MSFRLLPEPFPTHIETRTSLQPFLRFHHPIAVPVRTQISMSYHPAARIILQQHPYQHPQRMPLFRRTRICRASLSVQSSFITHTDTVCIVAPNVGTGLFHRPHRTDLSVATHIIVVSAPVKSPSAVLPLQILRREIHVWRSSRAMQYNQVNLSHSAPPFREELFPPLKMQNTHLNNRMMIHFIPISKNH